MQHDLKTWPVFFQQVKTGFKNFEVRRNDRNFQAGDILHLREWDPASGRYTGEVLDFAVPYMTDHGAAEGFVVMGLRPLVMDVVNDDEGGLSWQEIERVLDVGFIDRMAYELRSNEAAKGLFSDWHPDKRGALHELEHHYKKLAMELIEGTPEEIAEYAADVANIVMKIYQEFGPDNEPLYITSDKPFRAAELSIPHELAFWQTLTPGSPEAANALGVPWRPLLLNDRSDCLSWQAENAGSPTSPLAAHCTPEVRAATNWMPYPEFKPVGPGSWLCQCDSGDLFIYPTFGGTLPMRCRVLFDSYGVFRFAKINVMNSVIP